MKIKTLVLGSVGLASMLLVSSALADIGDTGSIISQTRNSGYFSGVGGEFTVIANPAPWVSNYAPEAKIGRGFQTFCLERYSPAGTGAYMINDRAIDGGVDLGFPDNGAGDPISVGTAYLYYMFASGQLDYNYTAGAGRSDDAGLLQAAIWDLEDEVAALDTNPFLTLVAGLFADPKVDQGAPGTDTWFDVYVLNIGPVGTQDWKKQDFLIWDKPGVPDGGITIMLLGLGLSALGLIRRKVA